MVGHVGEHSFVSVEVANCDRVIEVFSYTRVMGVGKLRGVCSCTEWGKAV